MENFTMYNPTSLHFGRNVTDNLGKTIERYGKRVLLVYGKGSIKKNGIYDRIMDQLNGIGAEVIEYSGIKPNPVVEDVNAAAETGRKHDVDVVLAVGGGSVIDSAKMIALTIPGEDSAWRIMIKMAKPKSAVPVITVLTLAATGTEMNPFAVLQNVQTHKKIGYGNPLIYPKHSFLDPSFTFSVSREYTAYGIADLIAHALENYFGAGDASLSDKFVYSIIREAMEFGPALLDDLQNYDLRAKIMYAATNALNGLTSYGRVAGDWGVHSIGHILSLLYDSPHGATLTVACPAWMKIIKERDPGRISELGKNLFSKSSPEETITTFEDLFAKLSCPLKMKDLNIDESKKQEIIDMMIKNKVNGNHFKLSKEDIEKIVELMYFN